MRSRAIITAGDRHPPRLGVKLALASTKPRLSRLSALARSLFTGTAPPSRRRAALSSADQSITAHCYAGAPRQTKYRSDLYAVERARGHDHPRAIRTSAAAGRIVWRCLAAPRALRPRPATAKGGVGSWPPHASRGSLPTAVWPCSRDWKSPCRPASWWRRVRRSRRGQTRTARNARPTCAVGLDADADADLGTAEAPAGRSSAEPRDRNRVKGVTRRTWPL